MPSAPTSILSNLVRPSTFTARKTAEAAVKNRNPQTTAGIRLVQYRYISNSLPRHAFRNSEDMANPFEKMEAEGEPKCEAPTTAAKAKKEEQDLPKLSAHEFRVYNRMAEHMDMFVSLRRELRLAKPCVCVRRRWG